jgi:midasin
METDSLRETLLMALRLLIFDRSIFLAHIPLEPLVALLQHKDLSIRLLAIELYTYAIGLADASKQEWISHWVHSDPNQPVMAIWENKTIDFGVLLVFESLRVRESKKTIAAREYFRDQDGRRKLSTSDLGPYTGDVCGVLIPRFGVSHRAKSDLVMTENTKVNLRNVARTIVNEKPLLLQSIPGAGKSFLIDEIAKLFGRYDGTFLRLCRKTYSRYRADHVDGSDGCKAFAWDVCHGYPGIIHLASRDFDDCCPGGKVDCHRGH